MAYFDHAAANRKKAISDKYDELKKHISLLYIKTRKETI